MPDTVFDGGVISAETVGRGNTSASALSTLSAGSENPACLTSKFDDSFYSTLLLDPSSNLPKEIVGPVSPLSGRTMHYLSAGAQKGVIFYEPLARLHDTEVLNPATPTTDFQSVDFSAHAIGFAGGDVWRKKGSIGISLAYLWSSLTVAEHRIGQTTDVKVDTAEGLRMNIGFRQPFGPTMWGLQLQNLPGVLWGSHYRRMTLPIRVKYGTTYRMSPGILFTAEAEQRFYREGGNDEQLFFIGQETQAGPLLTLRAGIYGEKLDDSKKRHLTAGATLKIKDKMTISFAMDVHELLDEKIRQSILSLHFPFQSLEEAQ